MSTEGHRKDCVLGVVSRPQPWFSCVIVFLAFSASANGQSLITDKEARAVRTEVAPVIDGVIEEAIWEGALVIDDLYQLMPNEYAEPTESSRFRVLFDANHLYVAAELNTEDPESIVAQVTRQGSSNGSDDTISVFVDGFNRKQSGYIFGLNLNGVRNEALVTDVVRFNADWQGIWDGAAVRTPYGWSAEIAIPFKSLSFDASADAWSFNVYRTLPRSNEIAAWVSKNQNQDAASSGVLTGLSGIVQGKGLDVVPSLTLRNERDFESGRESFSVEPAIDVFYKLGSGLNAALTVNTDFSDTEVDDVQIDLSQFNLFFPERRDFFLRDVNVFDFGSIGASFSFANPGGSERENGRPFFSRRIGLSAGGDPVDVIAGAKLSGKVDRFETGLLVVQQDRFEDIEADTLVIGRVSADILAESAIGAIVTHGDPRSNTENSLGGVDFRYRNSRLGTGRRLEFSSWYQQSDTQGLEGDDSAWGTTLSMPNAIGWRGLYQYQRLGENFNPALGFVSRTGVDFNRAALGYIWRYTDHSWLNRIQFGGHARRWRYLDDSTEQSSQNILALDIDTVEGDRIFFRWLDFGEQIRPGGSQPFSAVEVLLPETIYSWSRYGFGFRSADFRKLAWSFRFFDGEYYTGDRQILGGSVTFRPNRHWSLETDIEYWDVELPEGDFKVRTASLRAEWAPSSSLSWVNVAQYNNVSGRLGINSRLHWVPRAGQNAFFVVGHNFIENDETENIDGNFRSAQTDITLKANYTFRF